MGSWTGAVCVASRTMLNTGRFLWHAYRIDKKADKEREAGRLWSARLNPMNVIQFGILTEDAGRPFATQEELQFIEGGIFGRAEQAGDSDGAASVRPGTGGL